MSDKGKRRDKDRKEESSPVKVDWSLGGLFDGLGHLVESLGELAKKGEAIQKQGEFSVPGPGGKPLRGMYGFSIRTLAGGKPIVQTFGNIKPTPRGPEVQDTREPLVDVYEEKEEVVVLAELPGVDETEVRWELKGDILKLEAGAKERKYRKEVVVPVLQSEEPTKRSFKNGIFELRFRRKM